MTEAINLEGWEFNCIWGKGGNGFRYQVIAPNRQVFKEGGSFRSEWDAIAAGEALAVAFLSNPKSKNVAFWTTPKPVVRAVNF